MCDTAANASRLATRLCTAARDAGWSGPDPYDALGWSGWPRAITRRRRGRQLLIQIHARSPVDFRPLYRRDYPVISKTLAVFGTASVRLNQTGLARDALDRLAADVSTGTPAWGYPFPVQTRWSFYDADTPNAIATAFGGLALDEAANSLGEPAWRARATSAAEWALEALWRQADGWFAYHPSSDALIHNANLLVARLVWRVLGRDGSARERVVRAVERTLEAERGDGSFPYGNQSGLEWADSFHTAYVLESLADMIEVDPEIEPLLRRGVDSYLRRFFGPGGEAYLWPDRPYPRDGHSAGTALTTLAALADRGLVELARADPVARRTVTHVVRGRHAVHRRHRVGSTRVGYLRWCDAHVALGLASYGLAAAEPNL